MSQFKLTMGLAGALAVALGIFGIVQFRIAKTAAAELNESMQRQERANAKIAALEERLRAESDRAKAVESDNAALTAAIEKARIAKVSVPVATPVRLTNEAVRTRYERARELVRSGDPAEALRELLWCFDEGMVGSAGFTGVRRSYVLTAIMDLGGQNPAAVAALRERRDVAQQQIRAGAGDGGEIPDFIALNRVLGETPLTLAVFDQLPLADPRRRKMAIYASEVLLEHRRYSEVLSARPYAMMSSQFEMTTQERALPANAPDPEKLRSASRSFAITSTVKNIEVLAGAGDIVRARALAERLLAYDDSEPTRALIREHAGRAGHPELMPTTPTR